MKKLLIFAKDDCPTCVKLLKEVSNLEMAYDIIYSSKKNKEIFMKYCVMVAPTTILVNNEIEIDRFYGAKSKEFIEKFYEEEI